MPILGVVASGISGHLIPPSSFESIATITPTSTNFTFSSIPSTYTHLQIRGLFRNSSGSTGTARYLLTANGDSTTTNYVSHVLYGDGSGAYAASVSGQAGVYVNDAGINGGSSASYFGTSIVDIIDYNSSVKNKTFRFFCGGNLNGTGSVTLGSGLYLSTTSISSITINLGSSSFVTGSIFALYGIK